MEIETTDNGLLESIMDPRLTCRHCWKPFGESIDHLSPKIASSSVHSSSLYIIQSTTILSSEMPSSTGNGEFFVGTLVPFLPERVPAFFRKLTELFIVPNSTVVFFHPGYLYKSLWSIYYNEVDPRQNSLQNAELINAEFPIGT
ncbi:hypothetical protein DdX_14456 [Ditylenchus destructor]|uniref:Uncharacterized protein n=1 Tax=Ditylenchus destructor TaxID=166010 RepID=A0AAD4MR22_9BILA|nr:hypothetical protein DdX_14456 [Ditylenchus destructor]